LSATNPTCCPDANPGRHGGKPETNRLSYGRAYDNIKMGLSVTEMKLEMKITGNLQRMGFQNMGFLEKLN
jgi:hypothetical protein